MFSCVEQHGETGVCFCCRYIFDDHNKPGSISGRPGHEITKYLNLHEIERREVCMLFYEQVPSPQKARK